MSWLDRMCWERIRIKIRKRVCRVDSKGFNNYFYCNDDSTFSSCRVENAAPYLSNFEHGMDCMVSKTNNNLVIG